MCIIYRFFYYVVSVCYHTFAPIVFTPCTHMTAHPLTPPIPSLSLRMTPWSSASSVEGMRLRTGIR